MENDPEEPAPALDAVIGLGANLGSPEETLRQAAAELARAGDLIAVSALYRTLPVGGPPQPDFLNAAVRLCFRGGPLELLERLLAIERLAGRERRERWGPRCLDLDILWIRGPRFVTDGLEVPHVRLRERPFALRPLLDVAPDATDPADGAAYGQVLARLDASGVVELRRDWAAAGAAQV